MMIIKETSAGKIREQEATIFTIQNRAGDEIEILDLGLTLLSWRVHHAEKHQDVIIGYEKVEDYAQNTANFGCIVGRYANRIAFGQFTLNQKQYQLPCNLGQHHLHGGPEGFGSKHWKLLSKNADLEEATLTFHYISKNGEQGYPGNMEITVTIRFTNDNSISIIHKANCDQDTPVNLTNHAYFNLGNDVTVLDHIFEIKSDYYTEANQDLIPTGNLIHVKNTLFDFTTPTKIDWAERDSKKLLAHTNGYDVNFVTKDFNEMTTRKVAEVYNPNSGLSLIVSSNKPGLQLYTGNWLEGVAGKKGEVYRAHAGFCLEAQDFPDAPNHEQFPTTILKVGQTYFHEIVYKIKKGKV